MVDFATAHFREAQSLAESALPRPKCSPCFAGVMRFMGDHSKLGASLMLCPLSEQLCKEKEILHDEVYCQVIKQVTYNPKQESLMRGWLLLNLLTGYFLPSNTLMPYATKFLQQASSDPSKEACVVVEVLCVLLSKSCPLQKGRGARRLVIFMPGGVEYLTRIKTFTVMLQGRVDRGVQKGSPSRPQSLNQLALRLMTICLPEEYLHDYLLEDNLITMSLRRVTWKTPLHFENSIYTDFHYGQILWDYINGRILLGYSKEVEMQVSILAMLQHWAKPTEQQSPVPSRYACLRWSGMAGGRGRGLELLSTFCLLTEHVMKVPLFGYNIYLVERTSDETIPLPCFFGVNKEQMIVLDSDAQICRVIPLKQLQKMRTLRPSCEGGLPGMELDYGSAASPKTLWIELAFLLAI
uniref:MyTH4 domain-containing protein n=1 Tax=Nothoprocta perdicaria TaxID=30464 RepID=A0A8C6YWL7_NOTPE